MKKLAFILILILILIISIFASVIILRTYYIDVCPQPNRGEIEEVRVRAFNAQFLNYGGENPARAIEMLLNTIIRTNIDYPEKQVFVKFSSKEYILQETNQEETIKNLIKQINPQLKYDVDFTYNTENNLIEIINIMEK